MVQPLGSVPPSGVSPTPPTGAGGSTTNDDVLFVGMNAGAYQEAEALRHHARGRVQAVFGLAQQGTVIVTVNGQAHRCNLRTDEGIRTFVESLHLPAEQAASVTEVFRDYSGDPDTELINDPGAALDELAQIAQVWARAERGERMPSRLVISGHSLGAIAGIFGDDNGELSYDMLARLAEAMPTAARSVEDLHLSACYTGGQPTMERLLTVFPRLQTIWAYTEKAPGSAQGAITHLNQWEQATRGHQGELDRAVAAHSRKGDSVAVWTATHGYQNGQRPATVSELTAAKARSDQRMEDYRSGSIAVSSPGSGPLREHYNTIQRLLQHPELPASDRPFLEAERDEAIRLLFYTASVAPHFAQAHADTIRSGYQAIGLTPPNFARLSRAEALQAIAALETAVQGADDAPEVAWQLMELLTQGLRDLDPTLIPTAWI